MTKWDFLVNDYENKNIDYVQAFDTACKLLEQAKVEINNAVINNGFTCKYQADTVYNTVNDEYDIDSIENFIASVKFIQAKCDNIFDANVYTVPKIKIVENKKKESVQVKIMDVKKYVRLSDKSNALDDDFKSLYKIACTISTNIIKYGYEWQTNQDYKASVLNDDSIKVSNKAILKLLNSIKSKVEPDEKRCLTSATARAFIQYISRNPFRKISSGKMVIIDDYNERIIDDAVRSVITLSINDKLN